VNGLLNRNYSAAGGLGFPTSIPPSLIKLAMPRQVREVGKKKVTLKILLILSGKNEKVFIHHICVIDFIPSGHL
jgi:hypothetical protein